MIKSIAFVLSIVVLMPALGTTCPSESELFQKLSGTWEGQGSKTTLSSGNTWTLTVKTLASLNVQGELVTQNDWKEQEGFGDQITRSFKKVYKIRSLGKCKDGKLQLDFGSETGTTVVGEYDGRVLVFRQFLGSGFEFISKTRWFEKQSYNTGFFIKDGQVVQYSRMSYWRVP